MRRHHYLYGRSKWLTRDDVLPDLRAIHQRYAADQARTLGLLNPKGPGSWTRPDLSRMVYADGKVITPLFRAHPGDRVINRETGEIRAARAEPDAGLHFEGTGETAWGTKWVIVAVRSGDVHGRIILDTDWVPTPGGEAAVAMNCFRSLATRCPGAQGVIYDTALRGVHHQTLLRELGLLPINRVTAAKAGAKTPRRSEGQRVEKSTYIETREITLPDGSTTTISLFAKGGAVGIGTVAANGDLVFTPLRRIRTHRNADKHQYRWYNDYQLPDHLGHGSITVRLHGNDDDTRRKFNRTENVRPIPPRRPRLPTPLPPPQRRRIDQPCPRRHPLPPPRPLHRPPTPTPQPHHLRPHREQPGHPPPRTPVRGAARPARRLAPFKGSPRRLRRAHAAVNLPGQRQLRLEVP